MTNVQLKRKVGTGWEKINPLTKGECVTLQNGNTVEEELSALGSDCFSPTITQISTMSKVGVGENDVDISANVQEGYVKSAILSGQTLVNIFPTKSATYSSSTTGQIRIFTSTKLAKPIPVNGKAIFLYDNIFPYDSQNGFIQLYKTNENNLPAWIGASNFIKKSNGKNYIIISNTYDSEITHIDFYISNGVEGNYALDNMMVIEYQQGMENWDIPYFEGMQSVKLPVLTTTGKNLFDGLSYIDGFISQGNNYTVSSDNNVTSILVNVNKNTDYILSAKTKFSRSIVGGSLTPISIGTKTTNLNSERIGNTIKFNSSIYTNIIIYLNETKINIEDIQVEEGSVATSYEPYQSNILSASDDVVLRGIGDVTDTLDCLTGEVTERIGEVVLDGSEDGWIMSNTMIEEGFVRFYGNPINGMKTNSYLICDKLPQSIKAYGNGDAFECVAGRNNNTRINVKLKLETLGLVDNTVSNNSIAIFKSWLKNNNLKIKFELTTESVKTVDLTPGGTNPTTKPYVWDGGHIQLSSEEGSLTPSLEYSVTTSRGGQIIQNTQSIAKQDKRVYDLEMLLINASIDEAYKRLTLQNDVMVMNRECQTVASPLRYIMLQRLIEEKAYETQDMLDKLDVFFMYGEITDEQYFELFDIVLGIMTDTDLDITEEVE